MGLFPKLTWGRKPDAPVRAEPRVNRPRALTTAQSEIVITSSEQLEEALRTGNATQSGEYVTTAKALGVSAVYACVRLRSGVVANMPFDLKRRLDGGRREDADDHPLWTVLKRKPNRWMKPAQFKRMMTTHVLLRGNGYALKIRDLKGRVKELVPMDPDRVTVKQADDLGVTYRYTLKNGRQVELPQVDVLHLFCLSLDGIKGVTPITFARETIGGALAMEGHGNSTFRNGATMAGVLEHPNTLSQDAVDNIQSSMDEFRRGGAKEGRTLILEEGMKYERMAMTAQDSQWIQARGFANSDIYRFFGVPPHMMGDTEKTTSFGSGIESQTEGFVAFTAEDDLTMWEEACTVDLLDEPDLYVRANRASLVRANTKDRWEAYVKALQWGVFCPDDVLALEDKNPRSDGKGGVYYDPPNTAGGQNDPKKGESDVKTP